jgi:hypothetical protein
MTIVAEAHRVATVEAQSKGHALCTLRDLLRHLERWAWVGAEEDVVEFCRLHGLRIADMPQSRDRARPVVTL